MGMLMVVSKLSWLNFLCGCVIGGGSFMFILLHSFQHIEQGSIIRFDFFLGRELQLPETNMHLCGNSVRIKYTPIEMT